MSVFMLVGIGLVTGLTTVLFGFGGGFVTVPVIVWADAGLGADAAHVAVATSTVVMVVNAGVATAATDRGTVGLLRRSKTLLFLLVVGGAVGALAARWAAGPAVQWVFVAYLAATIVDLLARPGFLRPRAIARSRRRGEVAGIPAALGVPIGAIAAFVGVGGSVMTVPLLRRSGHGMRTATSLANPLTFAITAPALGVFLVAGTHLDASAAIFLLGSVDLGAAAALLIGALPVILILRRRPPRIPDGVHAWSHLALLVIVTAATVAASLRHA
ncbi:sulfite exporter TauE/SafE family protein [Actinoallomurus acaciae]|uniref:Probable membrane transporter protein n=1 Tax=Actinoallomurus acaciae TaxID=502577 RepID=A0ABV5YQD4_9ACTN